MPRVFNKANQFCVLWCSFAQQFFSGKKIKKEISYLSTTISRVTTSRALSYHWLRCRVSRNVVCELSANTSWLNPCCFSMNFESTVGNEEEKKLLETPGSVTRLDDIYKFLATKNLTKVDQIFWWLFWSISDCHYYIKSVWLFFGGGGELGNFLFHHLVTLLDRASERLRSWFSHDM